jgi:hypothetical protein
MSGYESISYKMRTAAEYETGVLIGATQSRDMSDNQTYPETAYDARGLGDNERMKLHQTTILLSAL